MLLFEFAITIKKLVAIISIATMKSLTSLSSTHQLALCLNHLSFLSHDLFNYLMLLNQFLTDQLVKHFGKIVKLEPQQLSQLINSWSFGTLKNKCQSNSGKLISMDFVFKFHLLLSKQREHHNLVTEQLELVMFIPAKFL